MDAGRGLLLRGRGDGTFDAIPGQKSGIMIYGEQRGCAAADFDGDGRPDLVVTQNGAETKLYRNRVGSVRDYAVPPEAREVRAHGDGRLEVTVP
jgi:hypothetical protein